jgi:hypothetical protein
VSAPRIARCQPAGTKAKTIPSSAISRSSSRAPLSRVWPGGRRPDASAKNSSKMRSN